MPNALANKTGFNIIIVHFYIRLKLDIIQYATGFFSVWLGTGSNPVDIIYSNRFRSHTGKDFIIKYTLSVCVRPFLQIFNTNSVNYCNSTNCKTFKKYCIGTHLQKSFCKYIRFMNY